MKVFVKASVCVGRARAHQELQALLRREVLHLVGEERGGAAITAGIELLHDRGFVQRLRGNEDGASLAGGGQ
jgi:hypothetical protein